jgi:hypothetical protein
MGRQRLEKGFMRVESRDEPASPEWVSLGGSDERGVKCVVED